MARFSTRIETRLAPADAFAYLADFSHAARYDPTVTSAVPTSPGLVGPGSTFRLLISVPANALAFEFHVVDFKPGEAVSFVCERRFVRLEERFHVAPGTDGGSVITYDRSAELRRFLARGEPLLARRLPKLAEPVVAGLRRVLAVAS